LQILTEESQIKKRTQTPCKNKFRVCWGPLLVILTKRETGTHLVWLACSLNSSAKAKNDVILLLYIYIYIYKTAGFTWVDRIPGRLGFTGPTPKWVFTSTRTGPRPGSAGSQVDPSGRSEF
jgi:hypothetical protein